LYFLLRAIVFHGIPVVSLTCTVSSMGVFFISRKEAKEQRGKET
jgi:hypothetical protein